MLMTVQMAPTLRLALLLQLVVVVVVMGVHQAQQDLVVVLVEVVSGAIPLVVLEQLIKGMQEEQVAHKLACTPVRVAVEQVQ
jgi:hypothetical protein